MEGLHILADGEEVVFPIAVEKENIGQDVNYQSYLDYLKVNYPNLHKFNIKLESDDPVEFDKLLQRDSIIHNAIDIQMYEHLNSADDIWDSITHRITNMGFMGRYARIATSIEHGRNYIFTFGEFSHVYPFLKSCVGDARERRRDLQLPQLDESLIDSYKLHYVNHYKGLFDSTSADFEIEKRTPYNRSFVYKTPRQTPLGTEWSVLSVDEVHVKLTKNFRDLYTRARYEQCVEEVSKSQRSHNFMVGRDYNIGETLSTHEDLYPSVIRDGLNIKRYVYEKFLHCSVSSCPGSVRIILDCIHNVVIISTTNPHFDCMEAHKRRVYDVVRKMFVINNADLSKLDEKYLAILRRYGLTYVESWIGSEDLESFHKTELTPSIHRYNYKREFGQSWSSQKNRSWVVDSFYNKDEETLRKKRKTASEKQIVDSELTALKVHDKTTNGISSWNTDLLRKSRIGGLIYRDEWEFHVDQRVNLKLREVFRVWRKFYFEIHDTIRNVISYRKLRSRQLEIYFSYGKFKGKIHRLYNQTMRVLNEAYEILEEWSPVYITDELLIKSYLGLKTNPVIHRDYSAYFHPYPLIKQFNFDARVYSSHDTQELLICDSKDQLVNCDDIYIYERNYRYFSSPQKQAEKIQKLYCHPSEKYMSYNPNLEELILMLHIDEPEFIKNRFFRATMFRNPKKFTADTSADLIQHHLKVQEHFTQIEKYEFDDIFQPYIYQMKFKVDDETRNAFLLCESKFDMLRFRKWVAEYRIKETPMNAMLFRQPASKEHIVDDETVLSRTLILQPKLHEKYPIPLIHYFIGCMIHQDYNDAVAISIIRRYLPLYRNKESDEHTLVINDRVVSKVTGKSRFIISQLEQELREFSNRPEYWNISVENDSFDDDEIYKLKLQLKRLLTVDEKNKKLILDGIELYTAAYQQDEYKDVFLATHRDHISLIEALAKKI